MGGAPQILICPFNDHGYYKKKEDEDSRGENWSKKHAIKQAGEQYASNEKFTNIPENIQKNMSFPPGNCHQTSSGGRVGEGLRVVAGLFLMTSPRMTPAPGTAAGSLTSRRTPTSRTWRRWPWLMTSCSSPPLGRSGSGSTSATRCPGRRRTPCARSVAPPLHCPPPDRWHLGSALVFFLPFQEGGECCQPPGNCHR